ncbi:MAG: hypothetical protein E6Q97_38435 [Desulfurellales bacterium]|nr:MAG: hypothetical protein E6Q97_38435 [Desulfurellales bacterium]
MAITLSNGSATVGTTEYSLSNNSTTLASRTDDAIAQVLLDLNAMTSAETYEFRIIEKVNAGTQRTAYVTRFTGVQPELFVSPSIILGDGWDATLKKIAGTDRSIAWSIRTVA